MAALRVETTESAGTLVVAVTGELDLRGATVLDPEIERAASEPGATAVVLDLRGLEFLDSSGLRSVMVADETLRAAGRSFSIVRGSESVQRVFAVTRMEERLPFVDDVPGPGGPEA